MTAVQQICDWLDSAQRVLFITGAGISAESGLPTYRGVAGLYEDPDPADGMSIETALSGAMFRRDPAVTWAHIATVERACRGASPCRAHHLITRMQQRLPAALVLTQNVDGLHQAAGADTVAIHGDVHELICTMCTWQERVPSYRHLAQLPRCPRCAAVIRPSVVLFGELLPDRPSRRMQSFLEGGVDLVFSIGTTSVFPYIAAPVYMAQAAGGHAVEINPGRSAVSDDVDIRLQTGAVDAMTTLWTTWTGEDP